MDDATEERPTPENGHGAHRTSPRLLMLLALVGPIAITATRGPELWTSPWTWWGVVTGSTVGVVLLVAGRRAARRDR